MHSIFVLIDHRPERSGPVHEAVELEWGERTRLTPLAAIPAVHEFASALPTPAAGRLLPMRSSRSRPRVLAARMRRRVRA